MKKFLSLFAAIFFAASMMATSITVPATVLDLQEPTMVEDAEWNGDVSYFLNDDVLVVSGLESYKSVANQTWITFTGTGSSTSTWDALAPFKGSDYYTNKSYATLQAGRYTAYLVTGCDSVWTYGYNNAATKYLAMNIYDLTGSEATVIDDATVEATHAVDMSALGKQATGVIKQALDATKTYLVVTLGTGSSNSRVFEVAFFRHPAAPQPTTQTLYCQISESWASWPAKYAVYYFKDETDNGWSEFMTAVTGEENTYTATIPVGYSKVIFVRLNGEATEANWDNKWSQTVNLTIPEGKNHFTVTSGGTGSECDGEWAKYPVIPTYYVAGTMTKWDDEKVEMNEGSYTFEGLAAGKYEIKVVDNNNNWLGFDKLNTTASDKNVYGEGDGNIKFVLGEEGDVTVAYDGSKITVTGATIVAPTTVFTVTVPEGTEKAFIAGNFTEWAPFEMTLKEEDVFTYTFDGDAADTAAYKYLAGSDWKYVEVDADGNELDGNRTYKAADEVAKWKAVPVALKYAKVTKAPINWTGHYIISYGDLKPHSAISGIDFVAAADAPEFVDGDTISVAEGFDIEIRFSETAGAYTIKLPNGKYIKLPSGGNAVNEDETAMALYMGYFAGENQEGVQIADKADLTATGTRMMYKNNNYYRSYTNKIDNASYVLPTLYRLVDEAFDCQDGPYAILVNGKDVEETVAGEEFDGYKQYVAYLSLSKGDSIQLINTSCGATWLPAIEEGGMSAHFKKGVNAATIDTTGCFDLYIKMKEGDDKLYIGAGICADDTVRYYIAGAGDGLGWDAEDYIASKQDTTVLNLKAGNYKLKVVAGENWLGYDKLTKVAEGLKDLDDDHNIGFTLKEDAAVTIVYNDTVFTVTGKFYVRVPEYKDLYLVPGVWAEDDAKIAAWIYTRKEGAEMEDQWTEFFAPKAEGNDTLTVKIDSEADSILFVRFNKTVETPVWSDDANVIWNKMEADTIDKAGLTYTITGWETGTWKVYVPEVPAKFYITGNAALLGVETEEEAWKADAIKSTETSYKLNLAAGDYKLKVVVGEDWKGFDALTTVANGLTGDTDDNICFTLTEAGEVNVHYDGEYFFLNGAFYVAPVDPQPTEHTYTVAGDSEAAFGTTWDPANTANDMTKQEDGTYKWEKAELTLAAGTVQFKVCEDHAWDVAYPASDYKLNIAEQGEYTITITFNPSAEDKVTAVATKTGSAVVIPTIAMHGNFTGSWIDTENFTVAEDNETASLTMNLSVGNYEFGMRIGGSANWTANGVTFTLENNSAVVVAGSGNLTLAANIEGEYTFIWTFATNTLSINFPDGEIVEPTMTDGYYIIGLHGWTVADLTENDLFWSTGIETGEYSLETTLAENDAFKVVQVVNDAIIAWFPEGMDNDYKVDAAHAGKVTIYFRPGYNGNDDWHEKCIYVAPNSDTPTGIDAVAADAKAVKVLRNGQLLIIKGEKTYNVMGQTIK